ncbi:MAG: hypothetical protein ACFFFG_01950 [Candidatus Thorarchaeota archaeon]
MSLDRSKWLRIVLTVVTLDYVVVGIGSVLLPEMFNPDATVPLLYNLISITFGLFVFVLSLDTDKYHDFLWVLVIQEVGVVLFHLYQTVAQIGDPFFSLTIAGFHFIYLVAIVYLEGTSLVPSFVKR